MTPVEITSADTHRLRRDVLRHRTPDTEVVWDGDDEVTTFHLGIRVGGEVVAISTWLARPCPIAPDRPAVQLRGMATDPHHLGEGFGSSLVRHGVARVRQSGDTSVWANARVTAISFYERLGFEALGPEFVTPATGHAHRVVRMSV